MEIITSPTFLIIAAGLLIFLAVGLLTYGFVPDKVDEDEIYGYRLTKRSRLLEENTLYGLLLPLIKVFAHYFRMVPENNNLIERLRKKLRSDLPRSGYMGAFTPNEFLGACCASALIVFASVMVLTTILSELPNIPIAAILAIAAVGIPFLTLHGSISARLVEIDRRLPYTIDLMVLSMRAGLDFMTALDRVVTRGQQQNPDDPMVQELGVVLQEMRVGTARSDALLNLCSRVDSEYLNSMVGAIIQSERRGTPLATVLEIQIDTIRNKRTQRVEKAASQAAVKILFPLMFIFASVIVVVMGAMFLRIQA